MKQQVEAMRNFDTVRCFREIKEKISKEIINMTYDELCEYLEQSPVQVKRVKDAS